MPDEDLEDGYDWMVVYSASVGGPTYVFPEQDFFYWWGQESIYNYPECFRILQDGEEGRYLAKIGLRLNNRGVYMSTNDPDFVTYPDIEDGYVPFEVY